MEGSTRERDAPLVSGARPRSACPFAEGRKHVEDESGRRFEGDTSAARRDEEERGENGARRTFCWLSNCAGGRNERESARRARDTPRKPTKPRRRAERTIIFSTMALVSPSRSLSFEFSGWILVVSILGAEVTTCGHHACCESFSSETVSS